MPRKSAHHSEESPVPRRTSARIAAVQAASPAKPPPVKSPRRKRQSAEVPKVAAEDAESQQSQLKSDTSLEEINGVETGSSTKESVIDSHELPSKKPKIKEAQEVTSVLSTAETSEPPQQTVATEESSACLDFEVVEKNSVPAPDSEEVKAAISAQGEDGSLLVDYVQVSKTELPPSESLEVKHVTPAAAPEEHAASKPTVEEPIVASIAHPLHSVNGNNHVHSEQDNMPTSVDVPSEPLNKASAPEAAAPCPDDTPTPMDASSESVNKAAVSESTVPVTAPAAGDANTDAVEVGLNSQ